MILLARCDSKYYDIKTQFSGNSEDMGGENKLVPLALDAQPQQRTRNTKGGL